MTSDIGRVLIVEDDIVYGRELRTIVEELALRPIGPIPGVRPALAVIGGVPLDAALLAVRVDDGLSFPVAHALEEHGIPYAFVTAVPGMVEAEPGMQGKPLVRKPFRAERIATALLECGLPIAPHTAVLSGHG